LIERYEARKPAKAGISGEIGLEAPPPEIEFPATRGPVVPIAPQSYGFSRRVRTAVFGAVGKAMNAVIGHRIAEVSVHRFVSDVAAYLRQALSEWEALTKGLALRT